MYFFYRMKITQRTEPVSKINEHALVQIGTGDGDSKAKKIQVDDLLSVIAKKTRLGALSKTVKQAKSRTQTLKVPLEKPQALRVCTNRTVANNVLRFISNFFSHLTLG